MNSYLAWALLSAITGHPIVALLIVLCGGWALDRFTLGVFPGPVRLVKRWQRASRLRSMLSVNPNDRRARFELADLLLARGRSADAIELLKPNIAAGDDDTPTLFLMGVACFGAGHPEQGETFLEEAGRQDPNYRSGEIDLELGKGRLAAGKLEEARAALEALCEKRPGTVQGRVLLARVHERLGHEDTARAILRDGWAEYAVAPRFVQRQERLWAWRIKPWRPFLYAYLAAGVAWLILSALPQLAAGAGVRGGAAF